MLKDGTAVDMRELAQILPLFHVRDDIHALAVELIHADCVPIQFAPIQLVPVHLGTDNQRSAFSRPAKLRLELLETGLHPEIPSAFAPPVRLCTRQKRIYLPPIPARLGYSASPAPPAIRPDCRPNTRHHLPFRYSQIPGIR